MTNTYSSISRVACMTIFAIAMAVIILQVALTRVISATASYHAVFVVLSIVMLGIAASGVAVYRHSKHETHLKQVERVVRYLSLAGIITVASLLIYLHVYHIGMFGPYSFGYALLSSALFYPAFYCSGYALAFLLLEFATCIGRLYWFDLAGAAFGCLVVVSLLDVIGVPNAVFLCGLIFVGASFGVANFTTTSKNWPYLFPAFSVVCMSLVCVFVFLTPTISAHYASSNRTDALLIKEKWNSLAKISVYREMPTLEKHAREFRQVVPNYPKEHDYVKRLWASGWGLSSLYDGPVAEHYYLDLDSGASTIIVGAGSGSKEELEFLRWDVTTFGYWLLPEEKNTKAFILGGGGGRDILTAKVFGVSSIDVAELNQDIVRIVDGDFGEFSGKPYSLPNVTTFLGEGRSTILRAMSKYDLIQMSMIDTFAATSSGAFVLAENNLYTTEAVQLFLDKLTPDGTLSISRWYSPEYQGELGKLLALIRNALYARGVSNPQKHFLIVYNRGYLNQGVATLLVKTRALSSEEIERVHLQANKMAFNIIWPVPEDQSIQPVLSAVLAGSAIASGFEEYDFRPSTDEWPFFFNFKHPLRSWLKALKIGDASIGSIATITMLAIIITLLLAAIRLIYKPLSKIAEQSSSKKEIFSNACYFAGIGFGFMVVELGLLQRYVLLLGHPTYALTVVLFTLLFCSALGSLLSEHVSFKQRLGVATWPICLAIMGGLFSALILPVIVEQSLQLPLSLRIITAMLCISPFGIGMGMIFPLGVRALISSGHTEIVPIMWGVNGIFSVFGSVIGMWIATVFGYTAVFLVGSLSYGLVLCSAGWRKAERGAAGKTAFG